MGHQPRVFRGIRTSVRDQVEPLKPIKAGERDSHRRGEITPAHEAGCLSDDIVGLGEKSQGPRISFGHSRVFPTSPSPGWVLPRDLLLSELETIGVESKWTKKSQNDRKLSSLD